jgi:3-hydroxyacyl-[acyl-carrier-protein] dehydratase
MSPAQTVLDRAAIEARLPHREPFLFLDRFEAAAATGAEAPRAVASWRVPEDADFFRGHYPGNPVTPGVILCEHAFQAAAVLLTELGESFGAERAVPVLARIERAKFRRIVRPGETLRTEVQLADRAGPAAYLEAKVWVGDELAMEVRCVLAKSGGTT